MKLTTFAAALTLALVSATTAFAKDVSVAPYDPDKDGTIDLAEAKAAGAKLFAMLDPDKDGTLDKKEIKGRLNKKAFKGADPDKDGTIDKKEYEALIEKAFKAANKDSDATVDGKELGSKKGQKLLALIENDNISVAAFDPDNDGSIDLAEAKAAGAKLFFLPPYSPKLNPAERLWLHLRDRYLSLRLFRDLDDIIRDLRATVDGPGPDAYMAPQIAAAEAFVRGLRPRF